LQLDAVAMVAAALILVTTIVLALPSGRRKREIEDEVIA